MAWWIQALEMSEKGKGIGRYRLTATSDEDGGGPYGLCNCPNGHVSAEEAQECSQAKGNAKRYG